MDESYGIFTTDGDTIAGTLHDEYAVSLAERLDESTASLYISTKNGVLLLGTAVNVQKKGRRPDTFIYLEKTTINKELLPRIDLSYIHEFYSRIERRLEKIEYEVRDLASDGEFFSERNRRVITGLSGSDAADYAVGRMLMSKEVVCICDNLSKSVDFAVAVTEKLYSYLSSGFTVVVSKRTFHEADLLVTEKYSGRVHIDLNTEDIDDKKWEKLYTGIGVFAQNPQIRQRLASETTHKKNREKLIREYKSSGKLTPAALRSFLEFTAEEGIGASDEKSPSFSKSAYEAQPGPAGRRPDESEYKNWKINDYDRENLMLEYERHMEKKQKGRITILALLAAVLIILAAVSFVFLGIPGFLKGEDGGSDIPHITPSATIAPTETKAAIIEKLNTTPGNIPSGYAGFGSAYMISLTEPADVSLEVTSEYSPDKEYYIMKYSPERYEWDMVNTTVAISSDSASAFISDTGIYRLFVKRVFDS